MRPADPSGDGTVRHGFPSAGAVTFEPGGQLEVSGGVRPTAAAALADLERSLAELAAAFAGEDAVLASVGVDVWHRADEVPRQLTAARYPGYAAFPYPEYSEVFFGGDWKVLRGSSWAIGAPLARCTYRNWDHPYRRQLLAGIRVAYDADDR